MKSKLAIWATRIVGALILALAVYMFLNNVEYESKFNSTQGQQHITINYIKTGIVGLMVFFFNEVLRYLDYIKYS